MSDVKLTQYSHGAGCGCKLSPAVLDTILHSDHKSPDFPLLLVGNDTRDDAAVFDQGDGTAIISTTDFFMPIVDDAFDFGRIASVNAISDVYAMGGEPMMAIAIFGWPIDKLAPEVARPLLDGARAVCAEAGIPLAGGHSIDCPEPIFGLAVTGKVDIHHLKKNNGARPGARLFLTKALGVGALSTAQKQQKLREEDAHIARDSMVKLNKVGATFGKLDYVQAMTDVTGFGLLGHLGEMCEGSGTRARIFIEKLPVLPKVKEYIAMGCVPGGTKRNWASYGHKMQQIEEGEQRYLLCDPQTSGGLLVAVDPAHEDDFLAVAKAEGLDLEAIGEMLEGGEGALVSL
ncbi:MAG: selenide, water dikinase SelD [Bacteroidia bacterium]